ncbi:MAG: hypothetical protein ABS913_05460 [Desemzia incerta]|uniref:hypothetical protein n=1 Tax=Desemzia incerta TaxID=82801 RepID=UPI003314878E
MKNTNLEEVIEKLAKENNLVIETKKKNESAVISDLAGLSLKIVNVLNHPIFTAGLNFAAAVSIGKFLYLLTEDSLKKEKRVKISDKGIGYIATFLNKSKVPEKKLEIIGPFSISNPNNALNKLTDINISGLDKIFGVLIAFKFEKSERSNQTNWEIYNNQGELVLSWETYEDI